MHLIKIEPHQLSFGWNSIHSGCMSLHYNIISDCGVCQNVTSSNITTCEISLLPESCSFAVEPIFCSNFKGNKSEPVIFNVSVFGNSHKLSY